MDELIEDLIKKLKVFKEDEFADLLHKSHNVIRNRDHLDPAAAFDEIAKILFVKVWVEREMKRKRQRQNSFTVELLDSQLGDNPLNSLFNETRQYYATDKMFNSDERINLKPNMGSEIVKLLKRYNLSDTSEGVKGIAFEAKTSTRRTSAFAKAGSFTIRRAPPSAHSASCRMCRKTH